MDTKRLCGELEADMDSMKNLRFSARLSYLTRIFSKNLITSINFFMLFHA